MRSHFIIVHNCMVAHTFLSKADTPFWEKGRQPSIIFCQNFYEIKKHITTRIKRDTQTFCCLLFLFMSLDYYLLFYLMILRHSLPGEPKRLRKNPLRKPGLDRGASTSQAGGATAGASAFQTPRRDRENFRKALVDIIM